MVSQARMYKQAATEMCLWEPTGMDLTVGGQVRTDSQARMGSPVAMEIDLSGLTDPKRVFLARAESQTKMASRARR